MLAVTVEKISLIISHVKWGIDFLLQQSLLSSASSSCCTAHELRLIDAHTQRETVSVCTSDAAECAVCLCRIDAGDEIRRLKCTHVFHRVCFDRWIGHGRWTCPLCRNHLKNNPASCSAGETRPEILVFDFAQFTSSGNTKDNWWLR